MVKKESVIVYIHTYSQRRGDRLIFAAQKVQLSAA